MKKHIVTVPLKFAVEADDPIAAKNYLMRLMQDDLNSVLDSWNDGANYDEITAVVCSNAEWAKLTEETTGFCEAVGCLEEGYEQDDGSYLCDAHAESVEKTVAELG